MTSKIWKKPKVGVFGSGVTVGKDTKADIIEDSDPEKLAEKVVREILRRK